MRYTYPIQTDAATTGGHQVLNEKLRAIENQMLHSPPAALRAAKSMLGEHELRNAPLYKARLFRLIGSCQLKLDRYDEAQRSLQQSERLLLRGGGLRSTTCSERCRSQLTMAEVFANRGLYQDALHYFSKAAQCAQQCKDRVLFTNVQQGKASVLATLGRYDAALLELGEAYQEAVRLEADSLVEEAGNLVGAVLCSQGRVYLQQGRLHQALAALSEGARKAGRDTSLDADIKAELAVVYERSGSPLQSIALFEQALHLYQRSGDRLRESRLRLKLSESYLRRKEADLAEPHIESCLRHFREIGAKTYEAESLKLRSAVYSQARQWKQALAHAKAALNLFEQSGDERNALRCNLQIADTFRQSRDLDSARSCLQDVLTQSVAIHDNEGECMARFGLGSIYREVGKTDNALALLSEAEELARNSQLRDLQSDIHYELYLTHNARSSADSSQQAILHLEEHASLQRSMLNSNTIKETYRLEQGLSQYTADTKLRTLQNTLDRIEKENSSLSSRLDDQRKSLSALAKSIINYCQTAPPEVARDLTELLSEFDLSKLAEVKEKQLSDEVRQRNSDFFARLYARCSRLTDTELLIAAFVREKFTTRTIATEFNVSERTVEKHREHIRKKLEFRTGQTFANFFATL